VANVDEADPPTPVDVASQRLAPAGESPMWWNSSRHLASFLATIDPHLIELIEDRSLYLLSELVALFVTHDLNCLTDNF
jgi:hypothetical protein